MQPILAEGEAFWPSSNTLDFTTSTWFSPSRMQKIAELAPRAGHC